MLGECPSFGLEDQVKYRWDDEVGGHNGKSANEPHYLCMCTSNYVGGGVQIVTSDGQCNMSSGITL